MFAYVGCFTSEKRHGHGKGISIFEVSESNRSWSLLEVFQTIPNPTFLALDHKNSHLYSAHGDGSEISAYAIDRTSGKLRFLNREATGGNNSAHLTVDPSDRYVILANGPGIAVYPIRQNGSLAPFNDKVVPPGEPGPHHSKQKDPHPHMVLFDSSGRWVLAADHGVDRVHIYGFNATQGKLVTKDSGSVKTRNGAAPRHLTFHPAKSIAYVLNEHDSTVAAYHWNADRGELVPFQVMTTLPTTHTGNNVTSEIAIAPSGKFLYVSNRGHDSIAIFSIAPDSGMLAPAGWEPTRGKHPRFFTLDESGDFMYVANLDSDTIVVFQVDHDTGQLSATGQIVETGSPSCIVFSKP